MLMFINRKIHEIVDSLSANAGRSDTHPTFVFCLLLVALLFASVPLETSQLAFALCGAVTYAISQSMPLRPKWRNAPKGKGVTSRHLHHDSKVPLARPRSRAPMQRTQARGTVSPQPQVEVRKPSSKPVVAPTFQNSGWDAEVDEMVDQLFPSEDAEKHVQQIATFVEERLASIIPEVKVTGYAVADFVRGTAFGVAVPDVEIVISVSPAVLAQRLQGGKFSSAGKIDARKLHKSALRTCTDRLVATGGFKFRRSAFRGEEPKVTLLVPASFGISDVSIPIDVTVNSTVPYNNMRLINECARRDARVRGLVLLVRRWAKDRGICHAAKGHLSPYHWSLLVMYFLQVGKASEEDVAHMPPVESFQLDSKTVVNGPSEDKVAVVDSAVSIGALFKDFVTFYRFTFDWEKEAVCVRTGKRGPPSLALALHIIVDEESHKSRVGPSIEDPFNTQHNLGSVMTFRSLERLHEEIARTEELCAKSASLTEVLEPWAPPEKGEDDDSGSRD